MSTTRRGLGALPIVAIVVLTACAPSARMTFPPLLAPGPSVTPLNWASEPGAVVARDAYVTAADRANAALDAAQRKYPIGLAPGVVTLGDGQAVARAYFKLASAAERTFIATVRRIDFPAGMRRDVDSLLQAEQTLLALDVAGTRVKTAKALDALVPEVIQATRDAAFASSVVRQDLGLKPDPPY